MNNKDRTLWTAIIIFIIGLLINITGCNKTGDITTFSGEKVVEFESLLNLKSPFTVNKENIEKFIDTSQTVEKQQKLLETVKWEGQFLRDKKLSKMEAIEDVTEYFNHLKNCYAGYLPNGGDEKFLREKKNVIDKIYEGITCQELKLILIDSMSFVQDAHFLIGDYRQNDSSESWHYVDDLYLGKDHKGLFEIKTNKYIKNSKEIEQFLKPSITPDGKFSYIIVAYGDEIEGIPEKIQFIDQQARDLSFMQSVGQKRDYSDPIYEKLNGLNYLKFQRFYFPNEKYQIKILLKAAKEMSESSVSILDLRGNGGGNSILSDQWVESYSKQKPQYSFNGTGILSKKAMDGSSNGQTWEEYIKYANFKVYDDNHTITEASEDMIEIENLLIILTDANMISASELLTDSLHHLNKTIFIGMPTAGCINSSSMFSAVLNNSNIPFGFGNMWNMFDEDYYTEFKGFQPDIWIPDINVETFSKFLSELK